MILVAGGFQNPRKRRPLVGNRGHTGGSQGDPLRIRPWSDSHGVSMVGFSWGLHKESNAFFHDFRRWAFVVRRKRRPLVENQGYTGGTRVGGMLRWIDHGRSSEAWSAHRSIPSLEVSEHIQSRDSPRKSTKSKQFPRLRPFAYGKTRDHWRRGRGDRGGAWATERVRGARVNSRPWS